MSDASTTRPTPTGPPFAWRLFIRGVMFIMRWLFGWRFSVRTEGELPPSDEPIVVVANHTSYVEPFLAVHAIWKATGHWAQPLAKAELFSVPILGPLARAAGAIPVERQSTEGRANAYRAAIERLAEGGAIYIAPEGTTSHDGELLPLRHGAARLALEAGCRVLVATHFGGQRAFSPVQTWPSRRVAFDVVLEPLDLVEDEDAAGLTGRIAATMLDRSEELRRDYAEHDITAPWWPPYPEPAEPTRTARENLEEYREAMSEAIEQARARMTTIATERDLDARYRSARDRARGAAEQARVRATELSDQVRQRADELVDLARSGQLSDELRQRAEDLQRQARLVADHAAELRAELREGAAHHPPQDHPPQDDAPQDDVEPRPVDDTARPAVPDDPPAA